MSSDVIVAQATSADLVEQARGPVVETDVLGEITRFSSAAEALLDWPAAEVEGRRLVDVLVAPEDRPRFQRWWDDLAQRPAVTTLEEFEVLSGDGTSFQCLFKVRWPTPAETHCELLVRALTERRVVEAEPCAIAALREQQALVQYVLNVVPHAIFWKDRDGRFLGGNASFLSYLGLASTGQMLGKTDGDFVPRDQAEFFRRCDSIVMDTGESMLGVEEPIRTADEDTRVLLTSKVPLRDPSGEVIGVVGIFADITERKFMERALEEASRAAESAARAKSEFLTVISHELRTPLTLILGPLELLLEKDVDLSPATKTELERVRRNAIRLRLLVDDILDVAKAEAGRAEVEWDVLDVAELACEIVADASAAARARGLALTFVEKAPVGLVTSDRRKFEKILLNLLGNALKFTPQGGQVVVTLDRVDEQHFNLSVRDTGIGIPTAEHERLFERFHQVDSSLHRKYEGTGLGLSLVKKFADLMNATVTVESESGRGSTFNVCFEAPRAPPPSAPESVAAEPAFGRRFFDEALSPASVHSAPASRPPPGEARGKVLVVEDNADMRAFLVSVLAQEYFVETADNGEDGLAAARAGAFDVIVSDIMMPGMDGLQLVARLKADPKLTDVPVILLTAKSTAEELATGLDHGAVDYVRKPFNPTELTARVRAAQRLHSTIQELTATVEALKNTQEALIQSEKMAAVGTLIAGLSHELNNPLAVIAMNAELLINNPDSRTVATKALPVIRTQTERCTHLVRGLLDFSRRKQVVREAVLLSSLLRPIRELAAPMARQRDIRLELEGATLADDALRVYVCRQEMETAILNLVTNAIAVAPRASTVAIRAQRASRGETKGVEISVVDHGKGIPEALLSRIFDPFFTTKPPGEGTGIGLPLARKIVESHGGTIRMESKVDYGTTATIWLPLSTGEVS